MDTPSLSAATSTWKLNLDVPGGTLTAIALSLVVGLLVVLSYRELRREGNAKRRRMLLALRLVTAVIGLFVAIQPVVETEHVHRVQGSLAVLADVSRSMSIRLKANDRTTRAASAEQLYRRWAPKGRGVSVFAFGADVRPSNLETLSRDPSSFDDDTQLGASVRRVIRELGPKVGGIVVVSDGLDLHGRLPLRELRSYGVRIHSVAVGGHESFYDDSIVRVDADPVAFLHQAARVRVTVRTSARAKRRIPVTLRRGDEVVREGVVEVSPKGEGKIELVFEPRQLERAVYRVTIPVMPDDAVPENNDRSFLVRVTRDKLRVLLVAGRPSWDERFLRAFLKRDPAIDLISFFILRTTSDLTLSTPQELALIPFPTDELFREHLNSFDVVFFQNFDFEPYQMGAYLPRIRDYVLDGGAFAMLGGDLSFASGRYGPTPLAEILPVKLPNGDPRAQELLDTDVFRPKLVPESSNHPLVALLPDAAANMAAWGALAPLEGVNRIADVENAGRALLVHPRGRTASGAAMPVLAVGQPGKGRTLAFTTDTSWHWGMTHAGKSGDASAYDRFWERALRWLARDPSLEPSRVVTDRERYGPSGRVVAMLRLRDDRYLPLSRRSFSVELRDAADRALRSETARTDASGRATVTFVGPKDAGGYRIVVRPAAGEEGACEEGFVVEVGGDELANPRADEPALRALAESTGGKFYSDLGKVPELSAFDATRSYRTGSSRSAPLSTPWAFAALLAALGAEWVLRRRWGRR